VINSQTETIEKAIHTMPWRRANSDSRRWDGSESRGLWCVCTMSPVRCFW